MPDQAPRLPARPSLEQLRKQAKELLREFRAGDAAAVQRVGTAIPRLADPALAGDVALADAQFVLAREHGFESWPKLVQHIDGNHPPGIARYERLAEEVARAYVAGDGMAIRKLNWTQSTSFVWDHEPERMRRRLPGWYASSSRSFELAVDDARHLVAKQSGMDSWEELVRNVAAESRRARGVAPEAGTERFYRIDEREQAIEVRGPMTEADWDRVFEVMAAMRLTALKGAGQITDAALERLSHLDHVTRLDLSFAQHLTAAGLRHLARLPLRDLDIGGWQTQVDDAALAVLRELPELRSFSAVWAQRISDAGIAHIAGCTHLESVNLMGTPTGDGALRALAGKARLAHVDAGNRVTPAGLGVLHDFPVFARRLPSEVTERARTADGEPTHLSLHPRPFVDGGLDALAALDGIFSFRLFGFDGSVHPVSGPALAPIARMHGVVSLWCDPSDDAMATIASMPYLRKLMCQDTAATDDGWVALGRSRTIESIWGRRNRELTARGFVALSTMPALRALAVNLGKVDDATLAALASFPRLRDLTPIGLGDDGFRHVGTCEKLETLTCMYTEDIGDAATEHIRGLHRLRKYYAGDTSITDRSLAVLAGLPSLESVELWSCNAITNVGVASLAKSPRLREVVLDGLPNVTRDVVSFFPSGVSVRVTA